MYVGICFRKIWLPQLSKRNDENHTNLLLCFPWFLAWRGHFSKQITSSSSAFSSVQITLFLPFEIPCSRGHELCCFLHANSCCFSYQSHFLDTLLSCSITFTFAQFFIQKTSQQKKVDKCRRRFFYISSHFKPNPWESSSLPNSSFFSYFFGGDAS